MLQNLRWYIRHSANLNTLWRLLWHRVKLAILMRTAGGRSALAANQKHADFAFDLSGAHLSLRLRTQDLPMLHEIFVAKQYELPGLHLDKNSLVIDTGAHIGLFSLFLHHYYGVEQLLCVEPSATNYAMLVAHAGNLPKAQTINMALSDHTGQAFFTETGLGYNHKLAESGAPVQLVDMPALLAKWPNKRIALLKMDIEGGEEAVFESKNLDWLQQVNALLIELHQNYRLAQLSTRIAPYGFKLQPIQGKDYLVFASRTDTK